MLSLQKRCTLLELFFLHNQLNIKLNCTRHTTILHVEANTTKTANNSPINRTNHNITHHVILPHLDNFMIPY